MRLVTTAPSGQWLKATDAYEKLIAKAETLAVRDVSKQARDQGRSAISAAGFSNKFANSLVVKFKPSSGYSLDPSAYIHTTINYADVFEHGATIVGKPFIWLPLPTVPAGHGRPHLTPRQYVQEVGPLITMHRAGKPPMLGARIQTGRLPPQPFGRFVSRRRLARGVSGRGTFQTIPMFVGVPAVSIPPKFDVDGIITEVASEDNIEKAYLKNLDEYQDPNGD
jgi:hypothetical protein